MKMKIMKTLALVVGLAAGSAAMAAGNIYEIVPCTQDGTALSGPIASVKSPLVAGETVYFKIRLPRTAVMKGLGQHWTIVHHGMSEVIDDFFSPLSIGIYVSGQLTYAKYVNYVDSTSDIRDFIFSYTTKPGDFALPIRLAGNGGPAGYSDDSSEYVLLNSDKWTIEDGSGNAATFQFGTDFDVVVSPSLSSGRQLDYSLALAGFYVKSVGFDPSWESSAYWRMVHSGSSITDSITPKLVADSAPSNSVTLHVWSMNEDIVKIVGGREVEMTVGYSGGTPVKQTVTVGDVTLAAGQTQISFSDMGFQLQGGDAEHVGQFTNLVLSAFTDYSYNKVGVRQVDYVTVPVQCSEALPPTLIVECEVATVTAPVREDGDMYRSTAQVSVYLSQAYEHPLEVTVTPSFQNADAVAAGANWGDYVRFSKTATEVSSLPAANPPTVIIPANSTGKQTLFLYALRSDENTIGEGNQIILTPSFDDTAAAAVITEKQSAGVWISADKPVVVTPSADAEISAVSGDDYELTVSVADTVADLADTATGYQVWFKSGATAKGGLLADAEGNVQYWIMKDGALVNRDDGSALTVNYPSSGDQKSQIYVISPISGKKSETVTFTAHIAEARTSTVETTDEKGNVYMEGDQATFKVTLSDKNDTGSTIYAFLKASDNAKADMFSGNPLFVVCGDTDSSKTQGLAINKNQIATTESKIKLLDGLSEDAGGLSLTFEVVLCTTPQYSDDPNKRVAGYDSNYLNILVYNVEPSITRIEMNGFESEYDGYQFDTIPKGMSQSFKAVVTDKGTYDLSTDFQTKWTVSRNGQQKFNTTITGNPNRDANMFTYDFTQSGTWVVKCQVKDKDMEDWGATPYSVTFEVLDSPHVVITAEESYLESDSKAKIHVGLDYWDGDFEDPLILRLAVGPRTAGRPNPGLLKLDPVYFVETVDGVDYYEIPVTGDEYSDVNGGIDIVAMDGTDAASFTLRGEITSTDELPKSQTPANEYYLASQVRVDVIDELPQCVVTPDPSASTNRIEVAGGLATGHTIRWRVTSDVDNDFSYTYSKWQEAGVKITFIGCENAADGCMTITEPTNGEFTPNFGSAQGDVDITLLIETKDGALPPYTWHFTVRPSKFIRTLASGPSGGVGTMMSRKYAQAKGRGAGHVWVEGGESPAGSQFNFLWNCGNRTSVAVYGMGYKVGDVDNGTLQPYDFMISPAGAPADGSPFYTYPNETHDSFLYTWLSHVFGENAGLTSSNLGESALPEIAGEGAVATPVGLPAAATEGGPYPETYVEAVFAREWRALDNCGDINQDGVPDRALIDYDFGVTFDGVGDLADLSGFNGDNDFLPGLSTGGNGIVPHVVGAWQAQGMAFNAFLEIRGFGSGLNAGYPNGDGSDPAPDYSANEKRAWLEWKGVNTQEELAAMSEDDVDSAFEANIADATADLAAANNGTGGWSPERPTNPTEEDTDKDGLADGYEYWFWYGAKVGYYDDGRWAGRMKGRRLNLDHIDIFDEIPSDDICLAFDPIVSAVAGDNDATRGSIASRDFDNDGLYDIEEYLIGTNPVDCDTDNGGLPDGFEVMWGLNPLSAKDETDPSVNNPDGDYMAYATLAGYQIVEFDADLGEGSKHYVYLAKEYDEDAGVLTGSLLGTGDYADLVWTIGPDTVPKATVIGESEVVDLAEIAADSITATPADGLSLIHNQVYQFFGFDPRTGWSIGCPHGYVRPRWCPICNTQDDDVKKVGAAGLAVNTRPYTTKDEYYYGKWKGMDVRRTVLETLRASCTNPNVAFSETTYGDSAAEYASTVHGADTDGNGAPDGWEAYVGYDPISYNAPDDASAPEDYDGDGLSCVAEYASTDGAAAYPEECETVRNNSHAADGWLNKFFPTDPHDADTDGDGMVDGTEGSAWKGTFCAGRRTWPAKFTFIYGAPEDDGLTICIRGGGMNPCSTDTDLDGLPDAWEHQYPGIVVTPEGAVVNAKDEAYTAALRICDGFGTDDYAPAGNFITGGMDATDGTDASTNPLVQDKHVGTIRDRDYDHDGLENFQEYLVQSVRCWRYDDTETPLMGRALKWPDDDSAPSYVTADGAYFTFDVYDGAATFAQLQASSLWAELGTGSTLSSLDEFDYAALGYFAQCDHEWDPGYQYGLKYMKRPQSRYYDSATDSVMMLPALAYVSTDPRQWDSDGDGMDDYWEVFHGLSPILGGSDLIALSYMNIAADMNMWTEASGLSGYDPVALPWLSGVPDADPDGDGIRNLDEAINGNLTSPTTYHTDPTPLWMTEPTTPASYVSQYYQTPISLVLGYPWTWGVNVNGAGEASSVSHMFSFEITEGYDTDGDWVGDGHEIVRSSTAITDPLDSGDPDRRAALYLPGADACAYSSSEGNVPVYETYDLFRQFTVEAWIKPDVVDRKQTIVERGFAYPASNLVNAESAWRANFRLEIGEDGVLRGVFDNDNAVQSGTVTLSTMSIAGGEIKPETWTHVAMTFDGTNVAMYVDGRCTTVAMTHLIPANGIIAITQEPGATNSFPLAGYATLPGANTVGARRQAVAFDWTAGFDQFTDFFKGYIAEVRFWDGARTQAEVAETYKKRMTPKLAAEQREAVYAKWKGSDEEAGATRNDADGNPMLPAQLITVYNFQQLPAAVDDANVAQTPSGFAHGVQDNTTLTEEETKIGWWEETPLKSTVYKDTRVVPYAQNVVSHLPMLDGSCEDSMFWTGAWAGYFPAVDNGVKSYAFPNGGNPYKGRSYMMERSLRIWRWLHLSEGRESSADEADDLAKRSTFQVRSEFTGLDDLVPLGGAFAKLDADYWDGQGADTAWEQTGADADGDGLPDWWEDNNGLDKNDAGDWAKMVSYNNTMIPAWEAYLRDVARGMQPDGSVMEEYKSTADADGNGLLDWWQNLYALTTGASGDDDGDGLSNYVEYMLSEVFGLKGTGGEWLRFAPDNARSVNPNVSDYFYRMNELYVGEIFTDHDRIRDLWESEYLAKSDAVSPYLYDADADADGDGWSNYAEFQAGTRPTVLASLGIDAVQIEEHPIPTIEMTIAYHGNQNIAGKPVVVKAWRDQTMVTKPDAVWTLGGAGDVTELGNGGSNVVTGVRYIGMNPQREMLMHLSPGSVVPTTVSIEFKDLAWVLVNLLTQQGYVSDASTAIWQTMLIDRQHAGETTGDIIDQLTKDVLGSIDYVTGAITLDFTKVSERLYISGDISGSSEDGSWMSIYDIPNSYVRVNWRSKLLTGGNVSTYYLGEADEPGEANNSLGHVKQGANTFIAFYDLNADGLHTPGEPYGFVRDVDVGWNYAKLSLELTDTTVVSPRYNLTLGAMAAEGAATGGAADGEATADPTDRETLWEASANDVSVLTNGIAAPAKDYVHVRIARIGVDSPTLRFPANYTAVLYDRILDLTADGHQMLTEADILGDVRNQFDLDWDASADGSGQRTLAETLAQFGQSYAFTNVYYGVYIGNGGINAQSTNETMLLSRLISRKFGNTRIQPEPVKIPGTLTSPAPTFTWKDSPNDNTYTAFRIRIRDEASGSYIWTSDYQLLPPRDENGVYSWTAPVRVGAVVPGGTAKLKNNKHYSWEISTYNARFRADSWISGGEFYTDVPSGGFDYGTARVAVRYYGPSSVAAARVRVQAFTTPDFSGDPVAEGFVGLDDASLSSTEAIKEPNASIIGLKTGTYYIRAFIDTDGDGRLSTDTTVTDGHVWESWGCYCTRDSRVGTIFTPKSVTVGPEYGEGDIIPVFIEDCDVDNDCLPDAWEWLESGSQSLAEMSSRSIDKNTGGFAMNSDLVGALAESAETAPGLAVSLAMRSLGTSRVAALLLGVDATGSDDAVDQALNNAGSDISVEAVSVEITAIELDREAKTVKVTADTEGKQSGSAAATSEIYTIPSGAESLTLTCTVLHCDALGEAWKEIASKEVKIDRTTTDYTFDLGGDVDLSSGFFKVKLAK